MTPRSAYPSDVSDARWALIEPALAAWRKARIDRRPTGNPAPTDLRDIFNAILYVNRTGIAWKYLPHDFPPHGTVYSYYAAWRTRESSPGSASQRTSRYIGHLSGRFGWSVRDSSCGGPSTSASFQDVSTAKGTTRSRSDSYPDCGRNALVSP